MLTNLTFSALFSSFILGFLDSLVIFLSGIYFIKWYAIKNRWDRSRKTAFRVSLLWLVINIPLEFFFLYFLGNSIIFDLLRVPLEIVILSFVVASYYEREYRESLIFLVKVQALLYLVGFIIRQLLRVYIHMITSDEIRIAEAGQTFYICTLFLIGITIFYLNWGDKIQFVKDKNTILLISITPGLFVLTTIFFDQGADFTPNFANNIIYGTLTSVITCTILKLSYQSRLSFEEVREIITLEKGKTSSFSRSGTVGGRSFDCRPGTRNYQL